VRDRVCPLRVVQRRPEAGDSGASIGTFERSNHPGDDGYGSHGRPFCRRPIRGPRSAMSGYSPMAAIRTLDRQQDPSHGVESMILKFPAPTRTMTCSSRARGHGGAGPKDEELAELEPIAKAVGILSVKTLAGRARPRTLHGPLSTFRKNAHPAPTTLAERQLNGIGVNLPRRHDARNCSSHRAA